MTKLDSLIAELCPDGVEYKRIDEIVFNKFWLMPATPKFTDDGEIPYITSKNIGNGKINFEKVKRITMSDYKSISSNRPVITNDILVSMIGTLGEVACVDEAQLPFYGQNMYLLRLNTDIIEIGYFLHFFNSPKIKSFLIANKNQASQGYLKANHVDLLNVPVPPLPIQREIVRIMDNFTEFTEELTTELATELAARKKQYEYYRNDLLSFGADVPVVTLGDIAQYSQARINADELDTDNYVGVDNILPDKRGKTISNYVPESGMFARYDADDILVGNIRPYLKKIWLADITGGTNGDVLVVHPTSETILPKYLYYLLSSDLFFSYNVQNSKGAKMPRGSKDAIMRYMISVPSLDEQARIVSLLDRFDALTTDISSGLPAEIAARQKQYEYYRDKLLTFKEKTE